MGVSIPKGLTIAGFRASIFKRALKAFERTNSPSNFVALKSVVGDVRNGAIIFEECLDHNLIASQEGRYELTEAGEAMATGKVAARTPLGRALALVDGLLDNAAALNSNPEAVRLVDQIWLFGSAMRGEETVGDIDIAISTSRRPPYDKDYKALRAEVERQLSTRTEAPQSFWSQLTGEHWLTERHLFGRKRHPLLAGAHLEINDLLELGSPCQLIFDRSRGGRVADEVLPQHPNSTGRSEEIGSPRTLPNFDQPTQLKPMDGRWVTGFSSFGTVSPYSLFGSWNDAAHALYPKPPRLLRVMVDGSDWNVERWKPKRLAAADLDGRERLLIAKSDGYAGLSVVLRRQLLFNDDAIEIQAWLESPELHNVRTRLGELPKEICSTIALILAADAERVLRRQLDRGQKLPTSIALQKAGTSELLQSQVLEPTADLLENRSVRIEFENWSGPLVSVKLI